MPDADRYQESAYFFGNVNESGTANPSSLSERKDFFIGFLRVSQMGNHQEVRVWV